MRILGIEEITFGATDLGRCRQFFLDWGLQLVNEDARTLVFECLNGCRVVVAHSDTPDLPKGIEPDPTLREVVWGVSSQSELDTLRNALQQQPHFVDTQHRVGCTDPNGLAVRVQVTQKRDVALHCAGSLDRQ